GTIEVRPAERRVLVEGRPATLGARAFDLLVALIAHRDRVVSKDELLDLVWPGLVVEENNLQVQVSALRKLLGPQAIATIPGRGYQFTLPEDRPFETGRAEPPSAARGGVPGQYLGLPADPTSPEKSTLQRPGIAGDTASGTPPVTHQNNLPRQLTR